MKPRPSDDGPKSYALAHACLREICIRSGSVKPADGDEVDARWQREGPVPNNRLESLGRSG